MTPTLVGESVGAAGGAHGGGMREEWAAVTGVLDVLEVLLVPLAR